MKLLIKSIFSLSLISCALLQVTVPALSFLKKKSGYNQSNKAEVSKKAHKQEGGTCYAFAIASVIRAARRRLRNYQQRNGMRLSSVPDHKKLVKRIVDRFGDEGASTRQVVKYYAPKFGMKYDVITWEEAEDAVVDEGRPVVYDFYPDSSQWKAFENFFKSNRDGILSKRRVDEARNHRAPGEGHAVVISGHSENSSYRYWKCKNSWSDTFGDNGYFRFSMDAFDDCPEEERFIDIYSEKCDKRIKYTASGRGKNGRGNRYEESSSSSGISTDESGYGTDQTQ